MIVQSYTDVRRVDEFLPRVVLLQLLVSLFLLVDTTIALFVSI